MHRRISTGFLALGLLCSAGLADTVFVRADLPVGGDGASWETAFGGSAGLSSALAEAQSGDEIWVAGGTYFPTTRTVASNARTATFSLKSGVAILGGFAGTETSASARNPQANIVTLSGDLSNNDQAWPSTTNKGENVYHVVSANGAAESGVLDGVSIIRGFANGASASDFDRGGGIIVLNGASPTLRSVKLINNRVTFGGGAIYVRGASLTVEDSLIEQNNGGAFGGAMDAFSNCTVTFRRSIIRGNSAARAGGLEIFGLVTCNVENCEITGNLSSGTTPGQHGGGGLFAADRSTMNVQNSTIANNGATVNTGGGAWIVNSTINMTNSVFVGNSVGGSTANAASMVSLQSGGTPASTFTPSYNLLQRTFAGTGNIVGAATFVNVLTNDFRLRPGSLGVDAGNSNLVPTSLLTDLTGKPRISNDQATTDVGIPNLAGAVVDMGAHERQACPADVGGQGGIAQADALLDNNDFAVFITLFFQQESRADVGIQGGLPGSDAQFNNDDFAAFITLFFQGCN